MNEALNVNALSNSNIQKISSQNIYEDMLNSNEMESLNPFDIIQKINDLNQQFAIENGGEDILEEGNIDNLDLLNSLDMIADKIGANDPKTGTNQFNTIGIRSLDSILDELLDTENDINSIKFDSDHSNVYELEDTVNIEILEDFKEELTYEQIKAGLNSEQKIIGSNTQKTIKVFNLYQTTDLLFLDDSEELSDLIIHKLISFWDIIIDFSKIKNISDSFLRGTFDNICKFYTPKELMQKIDIINIDEDIYQNIFKNIIPNAFKYWSSNNIHNIEFEKLELLKTLDPDSELILSNPDSVSARTIPFERIRSKGLGNKREKKLRYPIWYVERVTEEVIEKYNIDNAILKFIDSQIDINWKDVYYNCSLKDASKYKYQINPETFTEIFSFTEAIILRSCDEYLKELKFEIDSKRKEIEDTKELLPKKLLTAAGTCFQNLYLDDKMINQLPTITKIRLRKLEELEFILLDLEHKYIIKEDILRNIFEIIGFSCYRTGLDKVKLIAYHYLCRYLETITIPFKEDKKLHKVRGFVVPLEIFRYDLLNVLCFDDTLKKFIFTMKELIIKWVVKYTSGSRLAQMYFDILMISPDTLSEDILRLLALSVIKNKNPMTLRAVYSSYISIVHLIIDTNINGVGHMNKKYGNFSSLRNIKDPTQRDNHLYVPSKFKDSYPDTLLLRAWLYQNPKLYNENYHIMKRLHIYKFLELDSLRVLATKPEDVGIYDWVWYYTNFLHIIEKDDKAIYKIKSKFLKSDKKNSQLKIIEIMCHDLLYDKLKYTLIDPVVIGEVLGVIAEDISMRTINRGYMDKDFNLIVKSNQDYLNYIHESLSEIRNNL